jgi:hypothetical protein
MGGILHTREVKAEEQFILTRAFQICGPMNIVSRCPGCNVYHHYSNTRGVRDSMWNRVVLFSSNASSENYLPVPPFRDRQWWWRKIGDYLTSTIVKPT